MKVSLDWLKDYISLKGSAEVISERLTMAGLKVEKLESLKNDFVFELEITTNRPDWLSHLGVARELHAVTGASFSYPQAKIKTLPVQAVRKISVSTSNKDLCPYYSAVVLEGIEWQSTPQFMKTRLEACGIRSINLIVDITNYVLLEYGQPLHVFDLDLLSGNITARVSKEGERITAIDGITYELKKDIVISDDEGPVAIGGVMGGQRTEVSEKTKNVLLESAFFKPAAIRATSRRLALSSESSYRFERKVDPEGVKQASVRAVYLIHQYAKPKKISRLIEAGKLPIEKKTIKLEESDLRRVLGIKIPISKAKTYLGRLELKVISKGKSLAAKVPSFRSDLLQSIDLIEEVARIYGYDKIPQTLPVLAVAEPTVNPLLEFQEKARNVCVGLGFQEIVTFSIMDERLLREINIINECIRLVNPQNKELCFMRPHLISGMLQSIRRNLSVGENDVRFFEVGNRYIKQQGNHLPLEERVLALGISGESTVHWLDKKRPLTFSDLKGACLELLNRLGVRNNAFESFVHPLFQAGEAIAVTAGTKALGWFGTVSGKILKIFDVNKPVYYAELSIEALKNVAGLGFQIRDLPKYPSSPRDLTLIVDEEVKAGDIIKRILEMANNLASDVEVFDYFKGGQIPKGKKSLSFRIHYQSKERTLQNEEVNKLHFEIIDSLNELFGAELPKAKTT